MGAFSVFLTVIISFIAGAVTVAVIVYRKSKMSADGAKIKLEELTNKLRNIEKESLFLREKISRSGDKLTKQSRETQKIKDKLTEIKTKAKAVKNVKKPDNIDDLIKLF